MAVTRAVIPELPTILSVLPDKIVCIEEVSSLKVKPVAVTEALISFTAPTILVAV